MTLFSYSRLKCFQQCPRKYKFKYIDKMRTKQRETVELFFGKRVHETLWKLYRDVWNQRYIGLDELLEFLSDRWMRHWNDSIRIVKSGYDAVDYLSWAETCINEYYQRYKPFNHERTLGLEKRIIVPLNDSYHYRLCGYIDRVAKTDDGWYHIHEYKTSSYLPNREELKYNWQALLYAFLLKRRYSYIRKIKIVWHYLKFNKEFWMMHSDEEINAVNEEITLVIDTINRTSQYLPHRSRLCGWYEFEKVCNS
ncbi:MAG TPA: PD-(D/E)XK nuclease family protein [Candidatus Thermoplasmatota archaeon]|nr:PD-(D/E)XK nuclease family protein [Candidatus Thermoplasmatota archaeon]